MDLDAQDEERAALRLLDSLENGTGLADDEAAILAGDLDPVYVYIVVTFLRRNYPASHPAAHGVLERVTKMLSHKGTLPARYNEGKQDPISQWFESDYDYSQFRGQGYELIRLISDKLNG